jgi:hypothetical protein
LLLALSLPFWAWGAVGDHVIPGLPVSGFMAFCPAIAALILTWRQRGRASAFGFLRQSFDIGRLRGRWAWFALNLALPPALLAAAYGFMRIAGAETPTPEIAFHLLLIMFAAFFAAGLGEELGWFGYAYGPLERRFGAIGAAFVIGAIWAAWHTIPYFQTGRSAEWVVWHTLVTIALRVVAVWLFVNTGRSIFAASCFHAMCNVAYFSFPNGGSHYDAAYFAPIIGTAALLIALFWRPQTTVIRHTSAG